MAKVNYLNNKDLLVEIQKSKASYSSFIDEKYAVYDEVVQNIEDITPELIAATKEKKAKRIMADERQRQKDSGLKNYQINVEEIDPESIETSEVVWRVMTWDHIPDYALKRNKKKGDGDDYVKVMFPPFKHFIIENDEFVEVGRSHWEGGLQNGYFCQDQGRMTNKLCKMFMLLVDRYGSRGNWRGYCVDEATEALTKRGWLNLDQITEDDTIMSYENGQMKWSPIHDIYRGDFDGKMHRLHGAVESLITPRHKLVTERGLVKIEDIKEDDEIRLLAPLHENIIVDPSIMESISSQTREIVKASKIINFKDGKPVADVDYKGRVWCPKTEHGCFLARRNGSVFLTGNTYLDEMKARALLQLTTVGLQFDESRSETPNPFSYYTVVVQNAFTSVLNMEKKNQNIRDDILIMNGATPSITRQVEHEITQKTADWYEEKGIKPSDVKPNPRGRFHTSATLKSVKDKEAKEQAMAQNKEKEEKKAKKIIVESKKKTKTVLELNSELFSEEE